MNYPTASCEVSAPHWRTAMAPPVWRGWMLSELVNVLPVLGLQLRTTLSGDLGDAGVERLFHCLAAEPITELPKDCCIPMTPSRADARTFRPKLATPSPLFDGRDAVKHLAGRETFDRLHHRGRPRAWHRWHEKRPMVFVRAHLSKDDCIPFGHVSTDLFEHDIDFRVKDDPAILRRAPDRVKQGRDVVSFMPLVAHTRDHNTTAKAEASFEESDPRD